MKKILSVKQFVYYLVNFQVTTKLFNIVTTSLQSTNLTTFSSTSPSHHDNQRFFQNFSWNLKPSQVNLYYDHLINLF